MGTTPLDKSMNLLLRVNAAIKRYEHHLKVFTAVVLILKLFAGYSSYTTPLAVLDATLEITSVVVLIYVMTIIARKINFRFMNRHMMDRFDI